jgi:cellulose synthase/poly-beta-1,6-N-acetylglucosamine synthase-like glycosyltransferase
VVVFSDANAIFDADAVRELVRCLDDAKTGYVVGAALYSDHGSRAAESEGLYWKLEMYLKQLESAFFGVVGGDGAIYAIRRDLFKELRDDDISDFVNPLQIVAAGFRGVFNPRARCYERAGETFRQEFQRKRRIVNRSWRAVHRYGWLLASRADWRFLFMLLSHKVIRWFGLPLIVVAWLLNTGLLGEGRLYVLTWISISATFLLAAYGSLLDWGSRSAPRIVSVFYYFYLVALAAVLGIWDDFKGVRHTTWDHIRKPGT